MGGLTETGSSFGKGGGLTFLNKDDGISSPYKELEYKEEKLKYSTFIKKVGGHATEDQKPNLNSVHPM